LDRFLNTQLHLLRLRHHWTFTPSHSLHNATYATFALITRIRDIRAPQAPKARMFPRLTQHIHAILTSSIIHCHHEFTPLHPLEVTLSLEYRIRALPLFKRECSRASRAYSAFFTRHKTRRSRIIAVVSISFRQSSPSYPQVFIVFAHTRVTSRIPLHYRAFTPLWRLTPPPFPRLARHHYASLASSHSPQPHSHYTPLASHTLIATSLVHHMMH
jgi:hypothetical protein